MPDFHDPATREAMEREEPWTPKVGEKYWVIDDFGAVSVFNWDNDRIDKRPLAFGNCFPSEIEARRDLARTKIQRRKCPKLEKGEHYYCIGFYTGDAQFGANHGQRIADIKSAHGLVFKTLEEAEEWAPLYKFAYLGGDCPEGF